MTSVLPSFAAMSPAMNELEKLVREKEIAHGDDRLAYGTRSPRARRNLDGDLKPDQMRETAAGQARRLQATARGATAPSLLETLL